MKLLAAVVVLSSGAFAGVITNPSVAINWAGGFSPTGTTNTTISNSVSGGYTLTATACFQGFCPGQLTQVQGAQNLIAGTTVSDPITMSATSMTLTCNAANCGAIEIDFGYTFGMLNPPVGTTLPFNMSIDGTAPANFSFGFDGSLASCGTGCSSVDTGFEPVTADNNGAFSAVFHIGNFNFSQSLVKATIALSINGLGNGQSILLPSSANIVLGNVGAVPEPATAGLLLLGLGGLGLMFYKRR